MNTIHWTMQAEYRLTATRDNADQLLDQLSGLLFRLHLTAATQSRICRLLLETLQRQTESGALAIRLFTNALTAGSAAQSCGFFLIAKRGGSDTIEGEAVAALELYLFQ